MFSFSLFLQNGTSPGILDKDDKACSLSACFWKTAFPQAYLTTHVLFQRNDFSPGRLDKACSLSACSCTTAFHQAYSTKMTKHVLFQLLFAKRHFTRHTRQSLTKACLTKHVLFQLILQNGISPGILDKACSLSACFGKTAFHQAYLTKMAKHVLFHLGFEKRHFTRHT